MFWGLMPPANLDAPFFAVPAAAVALAITDKTALGLMLER
jgi:hypothetical protein